MKTRALPKARERADRVKRETIPYLQCQRYQGDFLYAANVINTLKECREFYYGKQYVDGYASDTPKPVMNICKEGVEKIAAKLTGTKRHVSFLADKPGEDLVKMDRFYEFQQGIMDDEAHIDEITRVGLIDGAAVSFTAYDRDTLKAQGIYEGYLKRHIVPFEQCFFSDPYQPDPQEQRYLGYWFDMDVAAAKALIEADGEERELKEELIASDGSAEGRQKDADTVRVYTRFFKCGGEVFFELATQYCYLTSHPHSLNPKYGGGKFAEGLKKEGEKYIRGCAQKGDYSVLDYDTDPQRYVIFEKAVRAKQGSFSKEKSKFSRYPISIFRPYPSGDCIIGQSFVSMIIPNNKLINYFYLMSALITQNHAMPKILVKPSALGNQVYDTSPNQILVDYSLLQENGGSGWGITRLPGSDAVNSNLLAQANDLIERTRQVYGFANLEGSNFSSDTSGYAYSQMVKQTNLVLEIPQRRLWRFVKENARTDLMYFRHYIDEARYYVRRDPEEVALNEDYRTMAQALIDRGQNPVIQPGTVLPRTGDSEWVKVDSKFFDADFTIDMEVEQGIAGSELTESQHFNQIMGYVAQGNMPANLLKVLINADPAISNKTRSRVLTSIEQLEVSQVSQLKARIEQLEQTLRTCQQYMQYSQDVVKSLQAKQKATERAAADQNKVAAKLVQDKDAQAQAAIQSSANSMSESEVKSLNAKGISGGSFSKGGDETIYNTSTAFSN